MHEVKDYCEGSHERGLFAELSFQTWARGSVLRYWMFRSRALFCDRSWTILMLWLGRLLAFINRLVEGWFGATTILAGERTGVT